MKTYSYSKKGFGARIVKSGNSWIAENLAGDFLASCGNKTLLIETLVLLAPRPQGVR